MSGKIIELMMKYPDITIAEIAQKLKRTSRTIEPELFINIENAIRFHGTRFSSSCVFSGNSDEGKRISVMRELRSRNVVLSRKKEFMDGSGTPS